MKNLFLILLLLLFASTAWGAGSSVVIEPGYADNNCIVLNFKCTGDDTNGDVPDTGTDTQTYLGKPFTHWIRGMYLYRVCAIPGATAPTDATDIFVMMDGDSDDSVDLLGSIDGGTTAYNGLNLISNDTMQCATPSIWIDRAGEQGTQYPLITGEITLKVASEQDVNDATFTIQMTFVK